jgi:predicted DNA-binding protein (UPF0251 family)
MAARLCVLVREGDSSRVLENRRMPANQPLLLGREGDVGVGVDPVDRAISRHAAKVTRTDSGWQVTVLNRHGVIVAPWAQPPGLVRGTFTQAWPRLALRVLGDAAVEHWVVLDDPTMAVPEYEHPPSEDTLPIRRDRAAYALTDAQLEAVRTVFADLLAWPPRRFTSAIPLKSAARQLGISIEAVQRRLEEARRKAVAAGHNRRCLLTDPEYVYVLVRAGSIVPRIDDLDPLLRDCQFI